MPLAVAARTMADFLAVRNMEVIAMFRYSYESLPMVQNSSTSRFS